MEDNYQTTKHGKKRIKQRRIPEALILEAVQKGKRAFLADRDAIEYRLTNVLGMRNRHLIVITSLDGKIITTYVGTPEKSRQHRQRIAQLK
jgi:hypothetical protein